MQSDKNVNEILDSLDGIKRAGAPDFFYTRLSAKMAAGYDEIPGNQRPVWSLRPVYITAVLVLILVVNAVVFLRNNNEATVVANDNETIQQSIAADYNLTDNNTVYDLNQDK
jgi:hypothetical protein